MSVPFCRVPEMQTFWGQPELQHRLTSLQIFCPFRAVVETLLAIEEALLAIDVALTAIEVQLLGFDVLDAFRTVVEGIHVVLRETVAFPSLSVGRGDALLVNVCVVMKVLCGRKTT